VFSLLALLHEGGWDEVLMVAVALGLAYLIIVWSGRRKSDEDEDEEPEDIDDGTEGSEDVRERGQDVPDDAEIAREQPPSL
jgi:hypothetical protein